MYLHSVHVRPWTHPVPYPMGTGGFSPRTKRPGYETNYSLPSSAEIKNAWRHTSAQYIFMVWCLIKPLLKYVFRIVFACIRMQLFSVVIFSVTPPFSVIFATQMGSYTQWHPVQRWERTTITLNGANCAHTLESCEPVVLVALVVMAGR
jgi:hypothetical protein